MKKRLVSLLPSATEIICALGCKDQLVGRSHECDFPAEVRRLPPCTKPKINTDAGSNEIERQVKSLLDQALSLYEIDTAKLKDLRPDIIFTQSQCDVCAVSEADLQKAISEILTVHPKIVSFRPQKLLDLWSDIQMAAETLGVANLGKELNKALKNRVADVIEKACELKKRPSVVCIEWIEPLMAAGNWVPELVDLAGGENLLSKPGKHSPWTSWEALTKADPEFIFVTPCGFDLNRTRREMAALESKDEWRRLWAVEAGKVFLIDGNQYFNRPGPRLVDSLEIIAEILNPKLFQFGYENQGWQRL